MLLEIIAGIILLAMAAIVVYFTFPRFMVNMQELLLDLAADLVNKAEDAAKEWKELFKTLQEDSKK